MSFEDAPSPSGVPDPEVELRTGEALLGGEAVPAHSFGLVLENAPAVGVHETEVVLGSWRQALLGGQPVPAPRFGLVLRERPRPLLYMRPRLNWALALPCSAASRNQRTASAASLRTPLPVGVPDPEHELRSGVALFGGQPKPFHRFGSVLEAHPWPVLYLTPR